MSCGWSSTCSLYRFGTLSSRHMPFGSLMIFHGATRVRRQETKWRRPESSMRESLTAAKSQWSAGPNLSVKSAPNPTLAPERTLLAALEAGRGLLAISKTTATITTYKPFRPSPCVVYLFRNSCRTLLFFYWLMMLDFKAFPQSCRLFYCPLFFHFALAFTRQTTTWMERSMDVFFFRFSFFGDWHQVVRFGSSHRYLESKRTCSGYMFLRPEIVGPALLPWRSLGVTQRRFFLFMQKHLRIHIACTHISTTTNMTRCASSVYTRCARLVTVQHVCTYICICGSSKRDFGLGRAYLYTWRKEKRRNVLCIVGLAGVLGCFVLFAI